MKRDRYIITGYSSRKALLGMGAASSIAKATGDAGRAGKVRRSCSVKTRRHPMKIGGPEPQRDHPWVVRNRLEQTGILVHKVKLNGSAASHVLHEDSGLGYKDLDLIFLVDLKGPDAFQVVKNAVLDCLLDFLPAGVNKEKITQMTLREAYVQKLVKVCTESDRWSLISLLNNNGKNIELKFVDTLRRQFEFSVDSFQILLDSILVRNQSLETPMCQSFLPAVTGESMFGDFDEALDHLRNRVIATRSPEEIRGGGLLKYCNLLVRGFRPKSEVDMKTMQRYMCSRYFIDFPDIREQLRKLKCYLQDHFVGMEDKRYEYLMTLHNVVLSEQNLVPAMPNFTCYYQPAAFMSDGNYNSYYLTPVQPMSTITIEGLTTFLPTSH
ncbi:unnamed protein product [Ranitomeya imitator]|uniref:Terminal nucleotidyltransferase 5B n=1 Tax=Ranitomeya imitator TaxID=111125 RepID=A0ABN9KSC6_9NEOB|nr:unnamed protein product [Ranitomeya imitator]